MEKLSKNKIRKQKRYSGKQKSTGLNVQQRQKIGRKKRKAISGIIVSLTNSGCTEIHSSIKKVLADKKKCVCKSKENTCSHPKKRKIKR